MSIVIGVDIGTQGTKSIAIDIDESKILDSALVNHEVLIPLPLHAEQDAQVYVDSFFESVKTLIDSQKVDASKVVAIGVSSLYSGSGIPVDELINPIDRAIIWMDRRAEPEVKELSQIYDLNELFNRTANSINSYFGVSKILWYKNHKPEVYEKTKYFLPVNTYVNYLLTGNIAIDHSSAANIGGVYNIHKHHWDYELIEKAGLNKDHFPPKIVCSADKVGNLSKEIATKLGLSTDVTVVAGGIDAPMALFATGVSNTEDHVAMMGTSTCWGFLSNTTKSISKDLVSLPYVYKDKEWLYTFGGTSTSGAIVTWFLNNFCSHEKILAEQEGISIFEYLEREFLSNTKPGSGGLLALPYFMGERSPIWDAKSTGMFIGLGMEHTKGDMYRALLESTAFSLRHNIELAVEQGLKISDRLIVVGGTSKSKPWMQIISDIVQFPVYSIEEDVEAALGDAILAAIGVGLIPDPSIAKSWFALKKTIDPNKDNFKVYDDMFDIYKRVYLNSHKEMNELRDIASRR